MIDAPAPAPGGATRADAQRDRILCAALQCFIEHGFHAATMASIAETAQMSAGLIYRYFENKNAIVLAIVQRQLDEKRALIRQLQSSEQFVDGLLHAFDELCSTAGGSMSAVLMLEMSAEATRSPPIAAALRESDRLTRAEFEDWLCRARSQGGAGLSAAQASSRSLAIRFVVDGLALRAAREPELDRAQVREALEELLRTLLKSSDQ